MQIKIFENKHVLSQAAAAHAANSLRTIIRDQGQARIVAATGTSQIEFLESLTMAVNMDWGRVELFHLDEYVGLPIAHPASFRKYLLDRLIRKTGITQYHFLDGERDPHAEAKRVGNELLSQPVDIAFAGIGENAHLAFNDPPADFRTEEPYLVVPLDEACRQQQVNEGWFAKLEDVPARAISMSVHQILQAKEILVIVPEARKAQAVKACFDSQISPMAPGSILLTHPKATVYLDRDSASLLSSRNRRS